jgi:signal transduction histidine kinase
VNAGRIPLRIVVFVAVGYSMFAALVSYWFTAATGLSLWTLQADRSATFSYILAMNLVLWGSWAVFAPVAFALAKQFPFARSEWRRPLCIHVTAALAMTGAHIVFVATARYVLQTWWGVTTSWAPNVRDAFFRTLDFELPVYWALIGVQHARDYYRQMRARDLAAAQLETQLVASQLEALQRQVHPHFLFNTLHAIAAFVQREPEKAEAMIERLSDLLRITLHRVGDQEVTLADELEYVRAYLGIQAVHFGPRLEVTYAIEASTLDLAVPNLLLQPLVENAIRHGLEPLPGGGRLSITAARQETTLVLKVADSGSGLPQRENAAGVGLANTRARLERLYGPAADLALSGTPGGGVTAVVVLPSRVLENHDHTRHRRGRPTHGPGTVARAAV